MSTTHRARPSRGRFTVLVTGILLTAAAAVTMPMLLLHGPSASALSAPIHVTDTVNIRPTPDTSRTPLGVIPQGTSPDFHCFTYGQNISGVSVWFNITWAGHWCVPGFTGLVFLDSDV
jgi:hypothetical protein